MIYPGNNLVEKCLFSVYIELYHISHVLHYLDQLYPVKPSQYRFTSLLQDQVSWGWCGEVTENLHSK